MGYKYRQTYIHIVAKHVDKHKRIDRAYIQQNKTDSLTISHKVLLTFSTYNSLRLNNPRKVPASRYVKLLLNNILRRDNNK